MLNFKKTHLVSLLLLTCFFCSCKQEPPQINVQNTLLGANGPRFHHHGRFRFHGKSNDTQKQNGPERTTFDAGASGPGYIATLLGESRFDIKVDYVDSSKGDLESDLISNTGTDIDEIMQSQSPATVDSITQVWVRQYTAGGTAPWEAVPLAGDEYWNDAVLYLPITAGAKHTVDTVAVAWNPTSNLVVITDQNIDDSTPFETKNKKHKSGSK